MGLDLCIGFSRTNSFASRTMQWFMRSKVSHIFVEVTLNDRMRTVIGTDEKGLHWQSLNLFESWAEIVARFTPIGPPLEDSFWWMFDEHGKSDYDYMAAGAIGFRNRLRWIWKIFGSPWRKSLDPKKLTCMEYTTRMFQHAQYPSMMDKDPEMFDTQQVMELMFKTPEEFRVDKVADIIKKEPYVHD